MTFLRVAAAKIFSAALSGGVAGVTVHQLVDGSTWRVYLAAAGSAALPHVVEAAKRLADASARLVWPDPWKK